MQKIFPTIKPRSGFSVLEIVFAVGIFVITVSGSTVAVLSAMEMNRLGQEEMIATQYATEGMEATRAIRDRDFSLLENTTSTGIGENAGVWVFEGAQNTFEKYTRTIQIEPVYRDGAMAIVESGGSLDANTKKITVTTAWDASSSRHNSVVLSTYLTYWQAPL